MTSERRGKTPEREG